MPDDGNIIMPPAEPMSRAIVTDVPSEALRVTLYADDGRSVAVPVSPIRALALAGELLAAAARRLS